MTSQPLNRHEAAVTAFLRTCDRAAVRSVAKRFPVLSQHDHEVIAATEVDASPLLDRLQPVRTIAGVPLHGKRAKSEQAELDRCQVCGSYDARCACCG